MPTRWPGRLPAMQMAGGPQISVDGPVISTAGPVISKTDTALCCCASPAVPIDCRACTLNSTLPVLFKNVKICPAVGVFGCLPYHVEPAPGGGYFIIAEDFVIDMDYVETFPLDADDPPSGVGCYWEGKIPVPEGECLDYAKTAGGPSNPLPPEAYFIWSNLTVYAYLGEPTVQFLLRGRAVTFADGGWALRNFFPYDAIVTDCSIPRHYTNTGGVCFGGLAAGYDGEALF